MDDPHAESQTGAPGPIRASLDTFTRHGTAEGWAIRPDNPVPCHVQIRLDGAVIAEDIADKFRPDLLRAGLGYGFCAFAARLRTPVPPGEHAFTLHDARTGAVINHHGPAQHAVPEHAPEDEAVAGLLNRLRGRRWRDEDLLACPEGLRLDAQYEHLGAERFLDRVFHFVLGRWPDQGALAYIGMLRRNEMTPERVFRAVLDSGERQAQAHRPLPSPFDPDFPFLPAPPGNDGAAAAA